MSFWQTFWAGLFLLGTLLFSFFCFAQNKWEKKLEGTWSASGKIPKTSMGWHQKWVFQKGKYLHEGYPPLHTKGKYKVIQEKGKLFLQLTDSKGTFPEDRKLPLSFLPKEKKCMLQNIVFTFTPPQK